MLCFIISVHLQFWFALQYKMQLKLEVLMILLVKVVEVL